MTLEFTPDALEAIAKKAIERNTGARGLRAIVEEVMTDVMFEIPSDPTIETCVITAGCITGGERPELTHNLNRKNLRSKEEKPAVVVEQPPRSEDSAS